MSGGDKGATPSGSGRREPDPQAVPSTAGIPDALVERWQEDQSEFFSDTIVEIVTDYAAWREKALLDDIAVMMGGHVDNWPEARRVTTAIALIDKTLAAAINTMPRHRFWGAGESDCPRDIKAPNGEIHTLRCKACGMDNPRFDTCTPLENSVVSTCSTLARRMGGSFIPYAPNPPGLATSQGFFRGRGKTSVENSPDDPAQAMSAGTAETRSGSGRSPPVRSEGCARTSLGDLP